MGDESFFYLKGKGDKYKAHASPSGVVPHYLNKKSSMGPRVSVWGAIGLAGAVDLHVWEHSHQLKGDELLEAIEAEGLPSLCRLSSHPVFVQDGCTAHKGEKMKEAFKKANVQMEYLEPYSPDLDWMEKAWSNLGAIVYENGRKEYKNKDELTTASRAWKSMASTKITVDV